MTTPYPAEVPTVPMIRAEIACCFPARAEAAQQRLDRALALLHSGLECDRAEYESLLREAWVITL